MKNRFRLSFKDAFLFVIRLMIVAFQFTLLLIILYRVLPVPVTPLMVIRGAGIDKKWVPMSKMSKSIPIAVITSEDPHFLEHYGFDFGAIKEAVSDNLSKGKKLRGGSTVSQQTAKNVFLWPARSWVRKGLEVPLTVAIELYWTKKRIIEVYLNVIEMGDGVYGIEAASRKYYKKSAVKLSNAEASLIVVCFPNPRRWTPAKPTKYIKRKQARVLRWMAGYDPIPAWWQE